MNNILIIILVIFSFQACKNNKTQAREPIKHQTQTVDKESIERNKGLNKREEDFIKNLISKDNKNNYINSGHGFWYYYITKKNEAKSIKSDDWVILNYELKDLSDNIIYNSDEIGEKKYHVDHENYFRGFHEAVKILKEGEEAEFIFPSNAAYGYHGDEKRIGQNIPLKMKLKIIKINKNK